MTSVNGLCVTCHEGSDGQLSAGKWMDQLRWQRLPSFQKLADYGCAGNLHQLFAGPKHGFGVVEAIHANIRNADQ
jgi:hypothetical protein